MKTRYRLGTLLLSTFAVVGCGNSAAPTAETSEPLTPLATLQTADAPSGKLSAPDESAPPLISPAELLEQVARLKATQIQPADPNVITPVAATQLASADKARHKEIAQLSLEVISQTHDDPASEQLFNNAVHYLSDAQVQLALTGDEKAERELIDNATDLLKRDAKSLAAMEANAKVVELARGKAEQSNAEEFAAAYANQARVFATNFSHEPNRAAVVLIDAGRWCDRRGYVDNAVACYTDLRTVFSDTLFASQADGPLRRLGMLGQPLLEFTGPTIDGGRVTREQYNGQPMVVAFWDSKDPDLLGTFSQLEAARRARTDIDVVLIGVCLDEDESAARVAMASLPQCPQVYSSIPEEQGRNNPLAQYYGVQDTPTLWLIDSRGVVVSLDALPTDIATLR